MKYTIAFDVYGTLINTSGIFNSLEKLMREKASLFMDTWRNKQLEYSFRRGLMNKYEDFSICTKDALAFCCLKFNIKLTKKQKADLMDEYKILPAFSDVKMGLQSLKDEGHKLFAFSNGNANAIVNLLDNAKISNYFEGIVSVEEVKMFKPNPMVYAHFNKKTGATKLNSCLVSSNPFDVIGAAAYGMKTAWVQRSSATIFDPWGIKPNETIHTIIELTDKLKKI